MEDINPTELKFDLIKSADKKAEIMLEEEVNDLENQEKELQTYREKVITEGEKLPEAIRQLNKIMIDNIDSEIDDTKKQR